MNITINMSESDVIRAMKTNQYSPMQLAVAKELKETPDNVEINYDSIIVWNDEINDYDSYKYCTDSINIVKNFMDEWAEYDDGNIVDFCLSPITFCVEPKKIKLPT